MTNSNKLQVHFIRAKIAPSCGEKSAEELLNEFFNTLNGKCVKVKMKKVDYNFVCIMVLYRLK